MSQDSTPLSDNCFEADDPSNRKEIVEVTPNARKKPFASKTKFNPLSYNAAETAKKGNTSTSRTGKTKQISYEFAKPPKGIYVKTHPSAEYHTSNLPVFVNENEGTFHYIDPILYESGDLPRRFQNACKVMDIHTAGLADGTFILWYVFVSSSKWRKAAVKAVEAARLEYVIVTSIKARQTYSIELADQAIAEPKWVSLPPFEQMLDDAFDSCIRDANDKVVTNYMSGGVAARQDNDEDAQ